MRKAELDDTLPPSKSWKAEEMSVHTAERQPLLLLVYKAHCKPSVMSISNSSHTEWIVRKLYQKQTNTTLFSPGAREFWQNVYMSGFLSLLLVPSVLLLSVTEE